MTGVTSCYGAKQKLRASAAGRMFDVVGHHTQPWLWIPGLGRVAPPGTTEDGSGDEVDQKRTFQSLKKKNPGSNARVFWCQTLSPVIWTREARARIITTGPELVTPR